MATMMQAPMMLKARAWEAEKAMQAGKMMQKATQSKMSTPWAVVGMLTAFVGGALLGMVGVKKGVMMASEDSQGWSMMKHHHHGEGSACRAKHDPMKQAAPGAEPGEERNEGE